MPAKTLSHVECVKLIRSPERYRPVLVSIDGQQPVTLTCFVLDDGDLLVPAGRDRALVRRAAGRTASVNITQRSLHPPGGWTVTGIGLARPLVAADRPDSLPRNLAPGAFDAGIRIAMARLTGCREH
ncbi:hypothetical protein LWP59_20670 [Amycolatopsis acidiphila]|uniref:Pyridoxamine 5'-phosphate oxidase family protein n=1 Tax=Amycolatopsis acidiphila TaxID=715473 RepID=A0A558A2Y4_9PSEU|nr:hypothetical protein [Amycolatopsis acidiphila]TVT18625.1 hypothetical protein FNH06_27180 [Amycolatopsis acidiphila]UIJ56606.1 hypothetical protein LWP59_20670 [Amycolatopsis acidiphila]GHG66416.1 hypothetical protein GCM10017788_24300 [Amycolatopsis acidiphila]